MSQQTYQEEADLFERALLTLAASDARLGPEIEADFQGYAPSATAVADELRSIGINGGELDALALTPKKSHMLMFAETPAFTFELNTVERLGFVAAQRERRLRPSVGVGAVCVSRKLLLSEAGAVRQESPVLWDWRQGNWFPSSPANHRRVPGSRKRVVGKREWVEYDVMESALPPIPTLAAIGEWSRRAMWRIRLSVPEAPALFLATDPTGVKSLLRLRDVPEGRTRREALRHWVKEHWRKNRADEAVEHQVREHLRGATECGWFGLHCRVMPSPIDEAKNRRHQGRLWRKVHGA